MSATRATPALARESLSTTARVELMWVTCANVAITLLNVVVGLLVARHFSAEDYGRISYFINIFGMLRLLAALGMTGQITFELARARGQTTPAGQRFYPLLTIRLATLLAITLLAIGAGYLRGDSLLMIGALTSMLALINDFGIGALQGLSLVRRVVSMLAVQSALYALGAVIVIARDLPASAIYIAYTLSFIPPILLIARWIFRFIGRPRASSAGLRGISASIRYAGGMYLLAIAGSAFTSFATLYLGGSGRFAAAAAITIPLNLVFMPCALASAAMSTVYFPRLSESYARGDVASVRALFWLFCHMVSATTILIAVGLALYPRCALALLYGTRYHDSAPLLALVAPVAYLYTMQTILTFTIVAQGRVRASLPGACASTALLFAVMVTTADRSNNLAWFAIAHSLAAAFGLIWQWRLVDSGIRRSLIETGKQLLVALALVGTVRAAVPDAPDRLIAVVTLLGLATAVYALWAWRALGGSR